MSKPMMAKVNLTDVIWVLFFVRAVEMATDMSGGFGFEVKGKMPILDLRLNRI
jgi:hypothetical protein